VKQRSCPDLCAEPDGIQCNALRRTLAAPPDGVTGSYTNVRAVLSCGLRPASLRYRW